MKLADYLVPLAVFESEAIALAWTARRVAVASTKRFFLMPLINGTGEGSGDMLANRIFAENCQDDAVHVRKFGMKV